MLTVAVTGGIGSGKSTVSARLAERGAVVVDSDRLAREVVAVGSAGLAAVVERFGPSVLTADGGLDRPALAAIVFSDPAARRALEAITHPRVRARFEQLAAAAPREAIVVNDIPLLVALPVAASFHLVVGVGADAGTRIERLIGRGLTDSDARARIAAQIDDDARRPLTDVWLDNSGTPDELGAAVARLWDDRLVPFRDLLERAAAAPRGRPGSVPYDPVWPVDAVRLMARVDRAAAPEVVRIDHVGPTAVPGRPAPDVLDLQLVVPDATAADRVTPALAQAGFVRAPDGSAIGDRGDRTPLRWLVNADPGQAVNLAVRTSDDPGWRSTLDRRDRLREAAAGQAPAAAAVVGQGPTHPCG